MEVAQKISESAHALGKGLEMATGALKATVQFGSIIFPPLAILTMGLKALEDGVKVYKAAAGDHAADLESIEGTLDLFKKLSKSDEMLRSKLDTLNKLLKLHQFDEEELVLVRDFTCRPFPCGACWDKRRKLTAPPLSPSPSPKTEQTAHPRRLCKLQRAGQQAR